MAKLLINSNGNDNKNSKNSRNKRNKEIDIIKGFACISVVYIHCSSPGFFGDLLVAINRYAVPFFFFTSGYYFLNTDLQITSKRIINKIKHLFILLRKAFLFYFMFCILFNKLKNKSWSIILFTKYLINKKNIIRFVILNTPFLYLHMWFVLALLYCYLFMLLLNIINSKIIISSFFEYFFLIFGIIGYHCLTEFRNILLIKLFKHIGIKISIHILFIFRALPFFIMGILVKKNKIKSMNSSFIALYFILGTLIVCLEMIIFNLSMNSYIGTYFQLIALIAFCLKERHNYNKAFDIISYIGRELSDKIYIYHSAVRNMFFLLLYKININIIKQKWFLYMRFFLVLFLSILFSYLITILNKVEAFKHKLFCC